MQEPEASAVVEAQVEEATKVSQEKSDELPGHEAPPPVETPPKDEAPPPVDEDE